MFFLMLLKNGLSLANTTGVLRMSFGVLRSPAVSGCLEFLGFRAGTVTIAHLFAYCRSKICMYLICLEGKSVTSKQEDVILFRSWLTD